MPLENLLVHRGKRDHCLLPGGTTRYSITLNCVRQLSAGSLSLCLLLNRTPQLGCAQNSLCNMHIQFSSWPKYVLCAVLPGEAWLLLVGWVISLVEMGERSICDGVEESRETYVWERVFFVSVKMGSVIFLVRGCLQ